MRRFLGTLLAALLSVGLVASVLATPARAARTPVVFVHGYTGSASNWTTAMSVFRSGGYASDELYAYEYNSYGDNRTNAAGLAAFVDQVRARTGAAQVDIVNHSMGGLVSLWYVSQLGGTAEVRRLASLAGANHGTTSAAACTTYETCRQMLPGSSFIATITRGDETPGPTTYATWYSPCDGIILPYSSTRLSGADNNYEFCTTHLGFLTDRGVLTEVRRFFN